jgi:hypothetical protein
MWLSWICFNRPLSDTQKNSQDTAYLDQTLRKLEARTGSDIPEGFDPEIPVFRPTLDPVKVRNTVSAVNPADVEGKGATAASLRYT